MIFHGSDDVVSAGWLYKVNPEGQLLKIEALDTRTESSPGLDLRDSWHWPQTMTYHDGTILLLAVAN